MRIPSSDIIGLPVITQQGVHLGHVVSLDIEIETHTITHYHVRTGIIRGLWHQELLIAASQVVSISPEKMVVEDNAASGLRRGVRKPRLVPT